VPQRLVEQVAHVGGVDVAHHDGVADAARPHAPGIVVDGRFKGGYITRHYGRPASNVHALQLEIAQRAYMDETTGRYDEPRAGALWATIERMLRACLDGAARLHA